ncbi:MAG: hypothetical protein JOZ18_00755 [Chloroflexi bacterium]|nr:hypothetical protein [Chloroflexota bacterium]
MKHTRIFDAGKGYDSITNLMTFTDCTVVMRENQWWMFACGDEKTLPEINLFSACLPCGSPLSAEGWKITPSDADASKPALLVGKSRSYWWDGKGGRHCPSYVKGFDPHTNQWVERIYYAGAAQSYLGPYNIGYVEWDGKSWVDQSAPVFTANEEWEHGSVYEPNLIYHAGRWKMWYVAGANQDDYLVQGYAESPDGRTNWSQHQIVFAPEEKVFDFCVIAVKDGYEAVFSRVNVSNADLPRTGLWWCRAATPSPHMANWSEPVRISGPGPWKPVLRYGETDPKMMFVFCDGVYLNTSGNGSPIHFTLDCIQVERPASSVQETHSVAR